jgi:GxxExxY protein
VARQINITYSLYGVTFEEGLRLDLLVDDKVIVEVKAVDMINPVRPAQILSHLQAGQPLIRVSP